MIIGVVLVVWGSSTLTRRLPRAYSSALGGDRLPVGRLVVRCVLDGCVLDGCVLDGVDGCLTEGLDGGIELLVVPAPITGARLETFSPSRRRMVITPWVARPERLIPSTAVRMTVPPSEISITW